MKCHFTRPRKRLVCTELRLDETRFHFPRRAEAEVAFHVSPGLARGPSMVVPASSRNRMAHVALPTVGDTERPVDKAFKFDAGVASNCSYFFQCKFPGKNHPPKPDSRKRIFSGLSLCIWVLTMRGIGGRSSSSKPGS